MSAATQKGNQFEREVKEILEAQGWKVFRQHRKPLFMKGKMITIGADIFGADIVAKKTGEKTRYIQVSTVENKSKKEAQLREHPITLAYESIELWLRIDGKRAYRVFHLAEVVDEVYEGEEGVGVASRLEFQEKATEAYREAAKC